MPDARALRPRGASQVSHPPADGRRLALDRLYVGDVDDVLGSGGHLSDVRRARCGLARPRRIRLGADRSPCIAEPGDTGPGKPGDAAGVVTLPEREDIEPVVPRLERVCVLEREMDQAVACTHLVSGGLLARLGLDRDARPAEDVEDLLLGPFEMRHAGC